MKRLLLHIGTGKTGTSSIQNFLYANRKKLRKHFNCFYPEYGISKGNHFGEIIYAHYPIVSWTTQRQTHEFKKLILQINTSDCETSIISCENFYHNLSSEDIKYLASQLRDFKVEIVCYVRRQDYYMESAWKQQVKVGLLKMSFEVFLTRHSDSKYLHEVHANYYRMLQPWASIFGIHSINIQIFDKNEWINNKLIDNFIHHCGIDVNKSKEKLRDIEITNKSLPSGIFKLLRNINAMNLLSKNEREQFIVSLKDLGIFNNNSLLSKSDRIAIIENYKASNTLLFYEFTNSGLPYCFDIGSIDKSITDNPDTSLLEDIAIQALVFSWRKSTNNCFTKNCLRIF